MRNVEAGFKLYPLLGGVRFAVFNWIMENLEDLREGRYRDFDDVEELIADLHS
jgi:hypothetical protein